MMNVESQFWYLKIANIMNMRVFCCLVKSDKSRMSQDESVSHFGVPWSPPPPAPAPISNHENITQDKN